MNQGSVTENARKGEGATRGRSGLSATRFVARVAIVDNPGWEA